MFRSLISRFTSLSLLIAAGLSLPAWEFQHAMLHRDSGHETSVHAGPGDHSQAPNESLTERDHDLDHEHLLIQSPVKPAGELAHADTPSRTPAPEFRPATVTHVIAPTSTAPARASPSHSDPSQPRAPPLA